MHSILDGATRSPKGEDRQCPVYLNQCATHYRIDPKVTSTLSKRQEGQPNWVKEISWKAQNRLNIRYKKLQSRLMQYNKIKVSIARELTGVIWEIGYKIQTSHS
jgi:transposase